MTAASREFEQKGPGPEHDNDRESRIYLLRQAQAGRIWLQQTRRSNKLWKFPNGKENTGPKYLVVDRHPPAATHPVLCRCPSIVIIINQTLLVDAPQVRAAAKHRPATTRSRPSSRAT